MSPVTKPWKYSSRQESALHVGIVAASRMHSCVPVKLLLVDRFREIVLPVDVRYNGIKNLNKIEATVL
jgi:hypothetical protein